jgi:hypothetical protein
LGFQLSKNHERIIECALQHSIIFFIRGGYRSGLSLRAGLSRSGLQFIGRIDTAHGKTELASLESARIDINFWMAEWLPGCGLKGRNNVALNQTGKFVRVFSSGLESKR